MRFSIVAALTTSMFVNGACIRKNDFCTVGQPNSVCCAGLVCALQPARTSGWKHRFLPASEACRDSTSMFPLSL
ncbi:uncharacterized protein EDB93DRAFT_1173461 [Suillus bovinus]|uniref:uncharacterized protein n=1 Tax=Suillus bovinus TaxID=48563 RepID=UPI001B86AD07|nr:uncharacterized protein EDB93DRAFT_1173461 [Suillus bovinus]KAG2133789.1 hypothetical protein EDB93DRAFT_1173461 [Suillus bovinus]